MTKKEFIVRVSIVAWAGGKSEAMEEAVSRGEDLAGILERRELAPWLDVPPVAPDLTSIPVAAFQFGPNPMSMKAILGDLAAKLDVSAGIPAGSWELVFRPAKELPSGLVKPSGLAPVKP